MMNTGMMVQKDRCFRLKHLSFVKSGIIGKKMWSPTDCLVPSFIVDTHD